MRAESPGLTPQPTALVNEWMLKMLTGGKDFSAQNREHLICMAAKAMRHMLVDHARVKKAGKRGKGEILQIQTGIDSAVLSDEKLLLVHDALDRLGRLNQRQAYVAELRSFQGLTVAEIAATLGVTSRTVDRD